MTGGRIYYNFDEKYDGNDFKIISSQKGNILQVFTQDNLPLLIINGHGYDYRIKGDYFLQGQNLYDLSTYDLIIPLQKNVTPWE